MNKYDTVEGRVNVSSSGSCVSHFSGMCSPSYECVLLSYSVSSFLQQCHTSGVCVILRNAVCVSYSVYPHQRTAQSEAHAGDVLAIAVDKCTWY
jgi:hypothetical protein